VYVFVTYAHRGMRGVLARGLKVAEHFKKEDVFFIHSGDDDWLKQAGYKYENVPFDVFVPPTEIVFPDNTECVIFCDIPTNHSYQTSLLMATRERKMPCVVLENIYRRGQTGEIVYKNTALTCDALILTGLDLFKSDEKDNIRIVLPPINFLDINTSEESALRRKYGIPEGKKIIFSTGYGDAEETVTKLAKIFRKEMPETVFVISTTEKIKSSGNRIFIPYLEKDDYYRLASMSDFWICKKGYIQILEAIVMRKPFVVTGKTQGFFDEWIDPELNRIINYYPNFCDELKNMVLRLMKNQDARRRFAQSLKKVQAGGSDGSMETAEIIRKTKFRPRKLKKTLVLSTATDKNISKVKELINDGGFVLPFIISIPFKLKGDKGRNMIMGFDYNTLGDNSDILKPGFSINYHFSYNSLHALAGVFPWYESLMGMIRQLANVSDEIIIVGEGTASLLVSLIHKKKGKVRVIKP